MTERLRAIRENDPVLWVNSNVGLVQLSPVSARLKLYPNQPYMHHVEFTPDGNRLTGLLTSIENLRLLHWLGFESEVVHTPTEAEIEWYIRVDAKNLDEEAGFFLPAE